MKHIQIVAAAFGLALLAAPVAHAFTIENQGTNGDGSARYADPDQRFSDSKDGKKIYQNGNTTIKFGGQMGTFDQRYNPNRLFDPVGRPGDGR